MVDGGSVSGRAGPIATLGCIGRALSASTHARAHDPLEEGRAGWEAAGQPPISTSPSGAATLEVDASLGCGVALDAAWPGCR